jgi:hypothetical protein
MVKIGNDQVVFSTSFVMDVHHHNSATFTIPDQPWFPFDLKLTEKPTESTELSAARWHHHDVSEKGSVLSFAVLPAGSTEFYSIGLGQATQGFQVQIVRQAIWNNVSMLVHVIIVREPR